MKNLFLKLVNSTGMLSLLISGVLISSSVFADAALLATRAEDFYNEIKIVEPYTRVISKESKKAILDYTMKGLQLVAEIEAEPKLSESKKTAMIDKILPSVGEIFFRSARHQADDKNNYRLGFDLQALRDGVDWSSFDNNKREIVEELAEKLKGLIEYYDLKPNQSEHKYVSALLKELKKPDISGKELKSAMTKLRYKYLVLRSLPRNIFYMGKEVANDLYLKASFSRSNTGSWVWNQKGASDREKVVKDLIAELDKYISDQFAYLDPESKVFEFQKNTFDKILEASIDLRKDRMFAQRVTFYGYLLATAYLVTNPPGFVNVLPGNTSDAALFHGLALWLPAMGGYTYAKYKTMTGNTLSYLENLVKKYVNLPVMNGESVDRDQMARQAMSGVQCLMLYGN